MVFEMVEKLLDLHEKEHGMIARDPVTAEIIIPTTDQPTTAAATTKQDKPKDYPYI